MKDNLIESYYFFKKSKKLSINVSRGLNKLLEKLSGFFNIRKNKNYICVQPKCLFDVFNCLKIEKNCLKDFLKLCNFTTIYIIKLT